MVSRTSMFRSIVESAQLALKKPVQDVPRAAGSNYDRFKALSSVQKKEVLSAVESLKNYETNSKAVNGRRKDLFRLMSSAQQKACNLVGYADKLKKIDAAISANYKFINDVANYTVDKYGISALDFELLDESKKKSTTSSSNYRVIEALGHYTRDWHPDNVGLELLPIYEYIALQLSALIPYESQKETCVVFPGSGLGRLAHEFAGWGFLSVHSIEFSGLMNAFVDYNYAGHRKEEYVIHPYVHTCSDFYSTESQLRTFEIKPLGSQPKNLHLYQGDFRDFEIPDRDSYKNIVVVTAFFIDTAENLMDYLDKIQKLVMPNGKVQRGYWVNVGPLKYGSAAQVELNADELKQIRHNLGWKDYNSVYTIYDKLSLGNETGLVGYLTDKESMWQGYYGLNMFACERKENKY
ncbi:hypothetical protein Cantr_10530 [Candida viswanathii]|uniref:Uncharacterized protein n=1 Tax=Candida viswanathii TaxID=5486 RepID=A0A367YGJ0_9ASCO|nr:hypothetical protein Cantr_10530 [Candida viswanathii]